MCMELLRQAGIRYVFHATRPQFLDSIANSGVIVASAFRQTNSTGSKKDIRGGGGKFVYCRVVIENSSTRVGYFGTRSSLKNAVYFVMPVEKLREYQWFISSVDLNGRLPTGMSGDDTGQNSKSREGTLKGIIFTGKLGSVNTGNYELGLYQGLQLCDISHLVLSDEVAFAHGDALTRVVHSIHDMKMEAYKPERMPPSQWVKVRRAKDGDNAYRVIKYGPGVITFSLTTERGTRLI